jgi:hypothetical protein
MKWYCQEYSRAGYAEIREGKVRHSVSTQGRTPAPMSVLDEKPQMRSLFPV